MWNTICVLDGVLVALFIYCMNTLPGHIDTWADATMPSCLWNRHYDWSIH